MARSNESFRYRYEAMETNELITLYCDGELIDDAELALADVLRERGVLPEKLLLKKENKAKSKVATKLEKQREKEMENESLSFFDLQRMEEMARLDSEQMSSLDEERDLNSRSTGISGLGFTIFALSAVWCAFLLIRTKSFLGQKFIIFSGSNLFDAQGLALSENAYLMLWLIGIIGICVGLWLLYTSFMKQSATAKEPAVVSEDRKKCPMCAELVMKEAKICKHCRHEFEEK